MLMRRILLLLTVVAAIAVVLASPAWAKNYTVDRNDDPDLTTTPTADDCTAAANDCSLRGAIKAAEAHTPRGDKITFNLPSPEPIGLRGPDLRVSDPKGLTIDGSSANITISGNDRVGVFFVTGKLTLSNLAVTHGFFPDGGAILNAGGTLTVRNSTLSDNRTFTSGGAIFNLGGTLTVRDSTLSNNQALREGGAISNQGRLTVGNSTLSNNRATVGGAIDNHISLEVSNSTLSGNIASLPDRAGGGGIFNRPDATTTLKSTIVANSGDGRDCVDENPTGITDGGYNFSEDTSCLRGATTSIGGVDPKLGDLAPNGGPTMTHALQPDSLAIDRGKSFGAGADQRGEQRPVDLLNFPNAPRGDGSDIGSYEVQQP
jgi:hypothetical protein